MRDIAIDILTVMIIVCFVFDKGQTTVNGSL